MHNLASASSEFQFVYTGEEAYGQGAVCLLGPGVVFLEWVSVCEVPGPWRALNECRSC